MPLTWSSLSAVLSKISYKDWHFRTVSKGDGFLLQVCFMAKDSKTGEMALQQCRKWYISSHACEGEIVRTVYKAIEAAELHEMQENFKFCGQAIYQPHLSPEDLALLIAGDWIGESIRLPMPAPEEFKQAARKMLEASKKPIMKKSVKPRKGSDNGNSTRRKTG